MSHNILELCYKAQAEIDLCRWTDQVEGTIYTIMLMVSQASSVPLYCLSTFVKAFKSVQVKL